jgi:hypothetical protein
MPPGLLGHAVRLLFAPRTLRPILPRRLPVAALLVRRHRHFKTTNSRRVPSTNTTAKPESKPTITKPNPNPTDSAKKGSPRCRRLFSLRFLALVPIGIVLLEIFAPRLVWITGPSMTPYLNEDYGVKHLRRDLVLVQPVHRVEGLRRGMVVIFPYVTSYHNVTTSRWKWGQ